MVSGTVPDNITLLNRAFSLDERIVKTVRKVFLETPNGDAMCSTSVVISTSASLAVTSAHCVYDLDTHRWFTSNWISVLAYDDDVTPLSIWVAKYFTALKGYTESTASSSGLNYDVAFVVVFQNNNKKIVQITSNQGIGFSMSYSQLIMSFGYPSNIANGELMSNCFSQGLVGKYGVKVCIGQTLRCGMMQGCSGGPWSQNFDANKGLGYVTSVNSYTCDLYMLYGPYFDNNIKALYDSIKSQVWWWWLINISRRLSCLLLFFRIFVA